MTPLRLKDIHIYICNMYMSNIYILFIDLYLSHRQKLEYPSPVTLGKGAVKEEFIVLL